MIISPVPGNVSFFEALASEVRMKIVHMLSEEDLNIKTLAERAGVSSPIMLKHIKKLEDAGLVTTRLVKRNGSTHKVCTLVFAEYRFSLDFRRRGLPGVRTFSIPIGHYARIDGKPTCGLATEHDVIGFRDDSRVFWEPERMEAQLLWFTRGYVEYVMPNYIALDQKITEIEISFEIASEAPDYVEDWPSDIDIYFNGIKLLTWCSPGDFGIKRGKLTPDWWASNQYGLLKTVRLLPEGVFMDEQKVSDITLDRLLQNSGLLWSIRFEVSEGEGHMGGITLFGKKFGNHAQDIMVRTFFVRNQCPVG